MKIGTALEHNEYFYIRIGKMQISIHKLCKTQEPWYKKWIYFTKEKENPNHIFSGSIFWLGWYYGNNVLNWK